MLRLVTGAYCAQRASQNRLRHYFERHKERNGWRIVEAGQQSDASAKPSVLKAVTKEIDRANVAALLAAEKITEARYEQLKEAQIRNERIPYRLNPEVPRSLAFVALRA